MLQNNSTENRKSRANVMVGFVSMQAKIPKFVSAHKSTTHQNTAPFLLYAERKQAKEREYDILQAYTAFNILQSNDLNLPIFPMIPNKIRSFATCCSTNTKDSRENSKERHGLSSCHKSAHVWTTI